MIIRLHLLLHYCDVHRQTTVSQYEFNFKEVIQIQTKLQIPKGVETYLKDEKPLKVARLSRFFLHQTDFRGFGFGTITQQGFLVALTLITESSCSAPSPPQTYPTQPSTINILSTIQLLTSARFRVQTTDTSIYTTISSYIPEWKYIFPQTCPYTLY